MNYKKDFPIFKNIPQLVYLDSAATSQKPQSVIDAIVEFYTNYNSNIHRGLYPIAENASAKVEEVREKVRGFINAKDSREIIFTKGTTEGINGVMYTWGQQNIQAGDVIVTTIMDHHANFVPWQQLALQKKAVFKVVSITNEGKLDEQDLLEKTKDAKIFVLPYVSNVLGSINWVSKFVAQIRESNPGIRILVDAAQAVSFKPVNVSELDCDFLVFSGHKIFAETGIGVLFVKKEVLEEMPPFLFGGDMIREVRVDKTTFADSPGKYEGGTVNISGIISLGAAIDYIQTIGMKNINDHETNLALLCVKQLKNIPGVEVFGPAEMIARSNIISFVMENIHPHDIAQIVADENICIRAGHHCTMPLHNFLGINASARVSFSLYNTEEDIEKFILSIKKAKKIFTKK